MSGDWQRLYFDQEGHAIWYTDENVESLEPPTYRDMLNSQTRRPSDELKSLLELEPTLREGGETKMKPSRIARKKIPPLLNQELRYPVYKDNEPTLWRSYKEYEKEGGSDKSRLKTQTSIAGTGTDSGILPDMSYQEQESLQYASGYTGPLEQVSHVGPMTCTSQCGRTEETVGLMDTTDKKSLFSMTSSTTSSDLGTEESLTPYYSRYAIDTPCKSLSKVGLYPGHQELSCSPRTGDLKSSISEWETQEHYSDDFDSYTTPEWDQWSSIMSDSSDSEMKETEE